MLMAGDEMDRTQGGNNNAYCQDNEISYVDWRRAETDSARSLMDFTARLIALRSRYETLRPSHFLHGDEIREGIHDADWFDQHGQPMTSEAWGEPEARTLTLRRSLDRPGGRVEVMLVLLNADCAEQKFVLPEPDLSWTMLLDSAHPETPATPLNEGCAQVAALSIRLLVGWMK
jgi:glycogen operon protein